MLTSLALENFKAFGRQQVIPLKPITLLFGANSSGKSSVIHSLLLLKQTIEESETPETVLLPKGKLVNLGSFKELTFRHDTARPVNITLGFAARRKVGIPRFRAYHLVPEEVSDGRLSYSFRYEEPGAVAVNKLRVLANTSDEVLVEAEPSDGDQRELMFARHASLDREAVRQMRITSVSSAPYLYRPHWERVEGEIPEERDAIARRLLMMSRRLEEGARDDDKSHRLSRLQAEKRSEEKFRTEVQREVEYLRKTQDRLSSLTFESFIQQTCARYKSGLLMLTNFLPTGWGLSRVQGERQVPSRFMAPPTRPRQYLEELPLLDLCFSRASQLRSLLDRIVYLGPLRDYPERHYIFSGNLSTEVGKSGRYTPDLLFKNPRLVETVDEWFTRFGIGYKLKVQSVRDEAVEDVFTVRLVDKKTDVSVSTLDVGFGISQVLPIVVQSLFSQERLIVVEQPEIHLHPRLQAEFGSLLVESVRTNHNQFIVETHSEHLVLRLQRLIRRGELSPDDVSVVYMERAEEGSIATPLRLDDAGKFLDRWPEGFFEEGFEERFGD